MPPRDLAPGWKIRCLKCGFTEDYGKIGRVVVWVSMFGVLGAVTGPGCDADACSSAVGRAVIGGLLGWFGWLGVLMLVFGMLGLSLGGHVGGGIGAVVGMVLGAASAWFAVYCDRKSAVKGENDTGTGSPCLLRCELAGGPRRERPVSVGVLISGGSAATVNTMNTKLLLKPLAVVAVAVLVAGVFHIGWLAVFIPAAKSGVMALKILGWLSAPVVTAVGYALGMSLGERLLTTRTTDFLRILVWPLVGCSLGAAALSWVGPMWAGIGTVVGGAASVVLREVGLLRA